MDRIAFISNESFYYWSQIILAMAAVTAILLFLGFYLRKSGNALAAVLTIPITLALSLVLGRLTHWYSNANSYGGFSEAMSNYSTGAYALYGVFFAALITACLLRLLRISKNILEMFDCMALAGAAAISVGRLGSLYDTTDRGVLIEGIRSLPVVYPVSNPVTGVVEYRLATFMLQAIAAGILFVVLAIFWFYAGSQRRSKKLRDGDVCQLFLLVYGATQIVLDSTRYDSLFMRSNGFISLVQILAAVAVVVPMVLFSIRMVKAMGFRYWHIALWVGMLGSLGGAGYMEYHVQRHGDQAVFAYSVMTSCLVLGVLITLVVRLLAVAHEQPAKKVKGGK